MATSKTGGAFGFIRKSIGAVTYSTQKDKAGKRVQVLRQKIQEMTNPNTIGQIMQRMKVTPAQRFFAAINNVDGTNLLEHSWEGIQYGTPSRREFFSQAMKANGPFIPRTVNRFLPAMYKISQGSLAEVVLTYKQNENSADANYGKYQFVTPNYTFDNSEAAGDQGEYLRAQLAAIAGGADNQLTVVWVKIVDGIYTPFIWRCVPSQLVLSPTDNTGVIPADLFVGASGNVAFMQIGGNNTPQSEVCVAAAIIRSAVDPSGNWLRSDSTMALSDNYYQSLYGADAQQAAIASYQSENGGNAVNSDWYLNLANGQTFPGMISVADGAYTINSNDVYPVTGTVSENGRSKIVIFTSDGAGTGDVIGNVNGTIQAITGATGSALVAEMMLSSFEYEFWKWQDKYVNQLPGYTVASSSDEGGGDDGGDPDPVNP